MGSMDDLGRGPAARDASGGHGGEADIGWLDSAPGYVTTDDAPGGRRRTLAWLTASLLAVALLAGAAVLTVGRERGSTNVPDGSAAIEQGYAAPWDGKASLRLPVTVAPNRDLVDGQEVTVSGSGFPPGADLGVIMCTSEAAFAGIQACDINTALSSLKGFPVTADAQGNVTTPYRVSTRISVPAGDPLTSAAATPPTSIIQDDGSVTIGATAAPSSTIDCTTGDIDPDVWPSVIPPSPTVDPGGFTCIVAVGMVSDYDKSGGAAVAFEGATFRTIDTTTTTATDQEPGAVTSEPPGGNPPASADPAPGEREPSRPATTAVGPPTSQPPVTPPPGPTTTSPYPDPPPPPDPDPPTTLGPP